MLKCIFYYYIKGSSLSGLIRCDISKKMHLRITSECNLNFEHIDYEYLDCLKGKDIIWYLK